MGQKLKVVITGGISSGKSIVSKMIEDSGFAIVDADSIAHEMLTKNAEKIQKVFGKEFVKDGLVDRKKLGLLVFEDKNKRDILEKILRDDIYNAIFNKARELEREKRPYVADIPLFFERRGRYKADLIGVVYAPKETQLQRLIQRDGLSVKGATLRINAQMDIEEKKTAADVIIDNSKDLTHLKKEVDKFIKILKDTYAS